MRCNRCWIYGRTAGRSITTLLPKVPSIGVGTRSVGRAVYSSIWINCARWFRMIREARQVWFHDFMFVQTETQIPKIPWSSLRDNPRNEEVGWNYIQDERNPWPVEGRIWLQDRIGANPALQNRFIKDGSVSEWDREKIGKYLDAVVCFRGLLLVLMHMTGGQPAPPQFFYRVQHRDSYTYYDPQTGFEARGHYKMDPSHYINGLKVKAHLNWADRSDEPTPFISVFDNYGISN